MANKMLRPDVAAPGLLEEDSLIGTAVPNCRVYVHDASYRAPLDRMTFKVAYLWNAAAASAYINDPLGAVHPFLEEEYAFTGIDEDKPLREQCLDYLLTLPRFLTGWVKT